ncbi:uncharacterized protein G2W53_023194 [Senna tora]|uniref:Uncharacterized protein n=1 Tax=Senna tora TaxID=362788 RepID=A0A834THZ1_9FABA|nr:uncharacterized protein G2W53_023194 [Senna tora]
MWRYIVELKGQSRNNSPKSTTTSIVQKAKLRKLKLGQGKLEIVEGKKYETVREKARCLKSLKALTTLAADAASTPPSSDFVSVIGGDVRW